MAQNLLTASLLGFEEAYYQSLRAKPAFPLWQSDSLECPQVIWLILVYYDKIMEMYFLFNILIAI